MRYIRKNKFAFVLLLTAVLSLVVLTIGGESLHNRIHKHESQAAHQQCPVYQLQTQAFTLISTVFFPALFLWVILICIIHRLQVFVVQSNYILPESHAPPFPLS